MLKFLDYFKVSYAPAQDCTGLQGIISSACMCVINTKPGGYLPCDDSNNWYVNHSFLTWTFLLWSAWVVHRYGSLAAWRPRNFKSCMEATKDLLLVSGLPLQMSVSSRISTRVETIVDQYKKYWNKCTILNHSKTIKIVYVSLLWFHKTNAQ